MSVDFGCGLQHAVQWMLLSEAPNGPLRASKSKFKYAFNKPSLKTPAHQLQSTDLFIYDNFSIVIFSVLIFEMHPRFPGLMRLCSWMKPQSSPQWMLNTHESVGFCVGPVSEQWSNVVRGQLGIQPSFIASRFMLLVSQWRSHTWKGQSSHLIQANVPLLTPVQQARHQGACDSQHLNNAIVPVDRQTDRNTHTH